MLKDGVDSQELAFPDPTVDVIDVEISEGKGSDIKVFAESVDGNVKTTKDGKIILIPQPSGQSERVSTASQRQGYSRTTLKN
jgi:hypothetical protein